MVYAASLVNRVNAALPRQRKWLLIPQHLQTVFAANCCITVTIMHFTFIVRHVGATFINVQLITWLWIILNDIRHQDEPE